jgi:hypothetical protein
MPGGGNSQTSTQTTTGGPWKPAQPFLKDAMSEAQRLYENKKGFKPYPGDTWVPFSSQSENALGRMESLASGGNPFYSGAAGFTQGLIGGQYNHDTSGFQDLMGAGPSTEGDYRAMLSGENDAYNQVRQTTANTLGDQIQRQFGGASYGSGSNADYLTRGVGDVLARMDSDNYFNRQNLQRGLLGDITGVQQQQFANRRGLLGDIANLNQMDINNRMGGLSMMDQVYQSQFLPAERMLQVGGMREAKAGEKLQADIDRWNIRQMAPWDRLAQAYGIFSGTGGQGNRVQTTVSQPTDPWSRILGGGLLASQFSA